MNVQDGWVEVRNSSGKLLFKYNPYTNMIEIRIGASVYHLIKLEEIRVKYGVALPANEVPMGVEVTD